MVEWGQMDFFILIFVGIFSLGLRFFMGKVRQVQRVLVVSDIFRKISCCYLISCFRGSYEVCWFCNMILLLVEVRKLLLLGDYIGMFSRNDILIMLVGSCFSMLGMLDIWDF